MAHREDSRLPATPVAMEFTIPAGELSRQLGLAKGSVEAKTTIPALSHIVLEAFGSAVSVMATDLGVSYTGSMLARVKSQGKLAVPAKKLIDWVGTFDGDSDITIKSTPNNWITLSCGRNRSRIACIEPSTYHELPELAPSIGAIPSDVIVSLLRRTQIASAVKAESNVALYGVHVEITPTEIVAAATNRNTVAVATHPLELEGWVDTAAKRFVLRSQAVQQLIKLLDSKTPCDVEILLADNHVRFAWGTSIFYVQLIDNTFPSSYMKMLGTAFDKSVLLPADSLRKAVTRVGQFASSETSTVLFSFSDQGLSVIASSNESGNGEETLEMDYNGPEVEIKISSLYLGNFLRLAGDSPLEVLFAGHDKPIEWRFEGDPSYRYVTSPRYDEIVKPNLFLVEPVAMAYGVD